MFVQGRLFGNLESAARIPLLHFDLSVLAAEISKLHDVIRRFEVRKFFRKHRGASKEALCFMWPPREKMELEHFPSCPNRKPKQPEP